MELDTLRRFLRLPHDPVTVLAKFGKLPGARYCFGDDDRAFVYVPATRQKDAVLLVAHADVDIDLGKPVTLHEENGRITNATEGDLLGGDDRAGCAILWQLKELGHGLLVVSGEERGLLGAKFLMADYPELADEINSRYQFVVEFDKGANDNFACYDVGTDEFHRYVEEQTGFTKAKIQRRSDIAALCRDICGANFSVGCYNEHHANEYVVVDEWLHTVDVVRKWLSQPVLPRFSRTPGAVRPEADTLRHFLSLPHHPEAVLDEFRQLPGARYHKGEDDDHAFVYIPATRRKDAVLLVAHADVDIDLGKPVQLHESIGIITNATEGDLLGADDRAGCAILWQLKEQGHGLLIVSGEERGELGAKMLMEDYPELADEINSRYQFVVEFDKALRGVYACYQVGTEAFESYVAEQTGFRKAKWQSRSDICVLCRDVCGVNLSVGYHDEHHANESIVINEWTFTLDIARKWLEQPELPRFLRE